METLDATMIGWSKSISTSRFTFLDRECLVLLDGLDEVVDEAVRSQVAERIVQANNPLRSLLELL